MVQSLFRHLHAWQVLCVIVGSDDEGSRVASLASRSARSFPGISKWPGHHVTLRVLTGFFVAIVAYVGRRYRPVVVLDVVLGLRLF